MNSKIWFITTIVLALALATVMFLDLGSFGSASLQKASIQKTQPAVEKTTDNIHVIKEVRPITNLADSNDLALEESYVFNFEEIEAFNECLDETMNNPKARAVCEQIAPDFPEERIGTFGRFLCWKFSFGHTDIESDCVDMYQ